MNDQEGKKQLANLLAQCFDIFPMYGREPEAARNIRSAFVVTLADFTIESIRQAFDFHLKHYREFPVPADIVHIILRGNRPPFERAVYIAICKKHVEDLRDEEWQYRKDYEKFILTGRY